MTVQRIIDRDCPSLWRRRHRAREGRNATGLGHSTLEGGAPRGNMHAANPVTLGDSARM